MQVRLLIGPNAGAVVEMDQMAAEIEIQFGTAEPVGDVPAAAVPPELAAEAAPLLPTAELPAVGAPTPEA